MPTSQTRSHRGGPNRAEANKTDATNETNLDQPMRAEGNGSRTIATIHPDRPRQSAGRKLVKWARRPTVKLGTARREASSFKLIVVVRLVAPPGMHPPRMTDRQPLCMHPVPLLSIGGRFGPDPVTGESGPARPDQAYGPPILFAAHCLLNCLTGWLASWCVWLSIRHRTTAANNNSEID